MHAFLFSLLISVFISCNPMLLFLQHGGSISHHCRSNVSMFSLCNGNLLCWMEPFISRVFNQWQTKQCFCGLLTINPRVLGFSYFGNNYVNAVTSCNPGKCKTVESNKDAGQWLDIQEKQMDFKRPYVRRSTLHHVVVYYASEALCQGQKKPIDVAKLTGRHQLPSIREL